MIVLYSLTPLGEGRGEGLKAEHQGKTLTLTLSQRERGPDANSPSRPIHSAVPLALAGPPDMPPFVAFVSFCSTALLPERHQPGGHPGPPRRGLGPTAAAGAAEYLVSNDRDILDIDPQILARLPFEIVAPSVFLRRIAG